MYISSIRFYCLGSHCRSYVGTWAKVPPKYNFRFGVGDCHLSEIYPFVPSVFCEFGDVGCLAWYDSFGYLTLEVVVYVRRVRSDVSFELDAVVPEALRRMCLQHLLSASFL